MGEVRSARFGVDAVAGDGREEVGVLLGQGYHGLHIGSADDVYHELLCIVGVKFRPRGELRLWLGSRRALWRRDDLLALELAGSMTAQLATDVEQVRCAHPMSKGR